MTLMQQEIKEQPDVLRRVAAKELDAARKLVDAIQARQVKYVIIAARGTSDHAATYAKYLWGIENGLPVGLAAPSVHTLYRRPVSYQDALVLGISQSGEGPDIIEVVSQARKDGALTACLTNNPDSQLTKTAEHSLFIHAGLEKSVAATKTYTGTMAVIALLSRLMKNASDPTLPLLQIADQMEIALKQEEAIKRLSQRYRFMQECIVLSRGINYATAAEAALKLIETSYVLAKAYSSADFLHGPFALIQEAFPVMLYAPEGAAFDSLLQVVEKLKERDAEILAVSHSPKMLNLATTSIEVESEVEEIYSPLLYIVYAQLFACHLAQTRGYDPDKPRGLTKVTQTR